MTTRTIFLAAWAAFTILIKLTGEAWLFAALLGAIPAILCAVVISVSRRVRAQPGSLPRRGTAPLTVSEESDGWTVIDARPEPLPALFTVLPILVGFMAAIAVANVGGPWRNISSLVVSAGFAWVVSAGLLMVWARSLQNGRRGVVGAPFAISVGAIRLPSRHQVPVGRIYALTLRNGVDPHVSYVVSNSTIGAMSAMGAAHAAAKVARIAYRVDLDHDGRSTTLAGGLTEPQARAVAAEVLRRLPTLV